MGETFLEITNPERMDERSARSWAEVANNKEQLMSLNLMLKAEKLGIWL